MSSSSQYSTFEYEKLDEDEVVPDLKGMTECLLVFDASYNSVINSDAQFVCVGYTNCFNAACVYYSETKHILDLKKELIYTGIRATEYTLPQGLTLGVYLDRITDCDWTKDNETKIARELFTQFREKI